MVRIKSGDLRNKRHKRILQHAKGFRGRASSCYRLSIPRVYKSMQYAYKSRKLLKRDTKSLFISRIGAGIRMVSDTLNYSQFMGLLSENQFLLNRKVLSDISTTEPNTFRDLVFINK